MIYLYTHVSGYLTASGKLTANGVTVGHSQGPLSQWDISSVSGSKTLFTASSVGRTKAGGAADLASVSCNRCAWIPGGKPHVVSWKGPST